MEGVEDGRRGSRMKGVCRCDAFWIMSGTVAAFAGWAGC
jgi:hypothetical protein